MRRSPTPERVLATVLFTDIVGSTELAARLGDRRWEELRRRHHAVIRGALKRFRGREIDTAGDGFFAIFDRPAQAIDCALAIIEPLRALGLEVRAGIHVGEVELGREKVGGIAVHTGARVLAAAQPGEIVVTETVKDLVAGSGIEFEDRGVSLLKGIPGERRLYAVAVPAPDAGLVGVPGTAERERPVEERRGGRIPWAVIGVAGTIALGAAAAGMLLLPRLLAGPIVAGADTVGRIPADGDAFDLSVAVGSRPTEVASGEGAIWVLNFGDQTLSRIDPAAGRVNRNQAVGGAPTGLAVGAGAAWVTTGFGGASGEAGSVIRFNAGTGEREDAIEVGSGAAGIAFGEGALWVTDRVRNRLLRIDPRTEQLDHVDVARGPEAVAVGHGAVWVASTLDNSLSRVQPEAPFDVAEISLPSSPTAIGIGEDEVWVTSHTGDVVMRIDPSREALLDSLRVGDGPTGVAAWRDEAWVALGLAGEVVRIGSTNGPAATVSVEGAANGIAVDEEGAAWVSVSEP